MANSLVDSGNKFVSNYNEKVRKQRETFSQIDSAMAILEKLPDFVDTTMDVLNANSFTYSDSPLGFLFNLIHVLGVDEETLKEWIVELLTKVLPTVEIGVKASLLANLKSLISCNSDPRIPLYLRKKVSDSVYTDILSEEYDDRGININVDAIDPWGLLDLTPFDEPGKNYYFGTDESEEKYFYLNDEIKRYDNFNERVAKLVRADDFNAFLWYVIHKGNKQAPIVVTISNGGFIYNEKEYKVSDEKNNPKRHFMGVTKLTCTDGSNIIPGTTLANTIDPNTIAICIGSSHTSDGTVTANTLVSVSSDWFSCNWYVDKSNYYGSNLGIKDKKKRDYSKEKAICNIRYCRQTDYKGDIIPNTPYNLKFSILPKPYILTTSMYKETLGSNEGRLHVQWRPIRLLFNANGEPDQKGKYSLISERYDLQPTLSNMQAIGDYITYDVYGITNDDVHINGGRLVINSKTGSYELKGPNGSGEPILDAILVECYPGLTVYEFNYDYIMGMKLFDPKVVCQRIFDNSSNPMYDAFFGLSLNRIKDKNKYPYLSGKQRVIEIVREIIEEDEDEINDCFYRFSNEQYDEMLKRTEEIRYRQLPYTQGYNNGEMADFSLVNQILEEYPETGTLEEQKTVIKNAIDAACATLDNTITDVALADSSTVKVDFLTNVLQQLVAAVVDAVLSPKVLMLLVVNKYLMEGEEGVEAFGTRELMQIMNNVVKSLIREVRDLIMQKLLDYIIKYLTPLALQLQAKITSEQFAAYMAIIKLLTAYFNKGVEVVTRASSILSAILSRFKKKHNKDTEIDLPSILDDINYADIYPTEKDNEPKLNDC